MVHYPESTDLHGVRQKVQRKKVPKKSLNSASLNSSSNP